MTAAVNDITGDSLRTKAASENYRNNYDMIFGKKDKNKQQTEAQSNTTNKDNNGTSSER